MLNDGGYGGGLNGGYGDGLKGGYGGGLNCGHGGGLNGGNGGGLNGGYGGCWTVVMAVVERGYGGGCEGPNVCVFFFIYLCEDTNYKNTRV